MINEALRLFRVFNDLKLTELAEILEISASYLSEIENGKKNPNIIILNKYANHFNIPTSAIFQFSEKLQEDSVGTKSKIARNLVRLMQNIECNCNDQ